VFGHDKVRLLDGGLAAWKESGYAAEDTTPEIRSTVRQPASFNERLVRTYSQMLTNLETASDQMIDVRATARYLGKATQDKRPGHVPGAINLPVLDCLDKNGHELIPVSEMKEHFDAAGIDMAKPTVAYCGGGGSSPVVAFGAYLLGYTEIAIYDGAWEDWANHPGSPVAPGSLDP